MGLAALWGRVGTLGVREEDATDERRRVALTNYGALIGASSCSAFAIGYALGGRAFRDLLLANVAVIVAHLGTLLLASRGRRTLAKYTLLLTVHALIIYATLRLGLGVGFQYYFFLLAVLPFLFFSEAQMPRRIAFAALSTVCCLFVFFAVPVADVADLPAGAIGDCYMVAAGLPVRREDHVEAAADMALGIQAALERINVEKGYGLRLRIGLHTGPVIAGVIGKRKFIYDLWGDTVNTASRMESSGVAEEIQVSEEVHDRLVGKYELESRGVIKVKGKGELATYLLRGKIVQPPALVPAATTSASV